MHGPLYLEGFPLQDKIPGGSLNLHSNQLRSLKLSPERNCWRLCPRPEENDGYMNGLAQPHDMRSCGWEVAEVYDLDIGVKVETCKVCGHQNRHGIDAHLDGTLEHWEKASLGSERMEDL